MPDLHVLQRRPTRACAARSAASSSSSTSAWRSGRRLHPTRPPSPLPRPCPLAPCPTLLPGAAARTPPAAPPPRNQPLRSLQHERRDQEHPERGQPRCIHRRQCQGPRQADRALPRGWPCPALPSLPGSAAQQPAVTLSASPLPARGQSCRAGATWQPPRPSAGPGQEAPGASPPAAGGALSSSQLVARNWPLGTPARAAPQHTAGSRPAALAAHSADGPPAAPPLPPPPSPQPRTQAQQPPQIMTVTPASADQQNWGCADCQTSNLYWRATCVRCNKPNPNPQSQQIVVRPFASPLAAATRSCPRAPRARCGRR
jgi:hypothetical protein